jgi:hypothetical protein
MDYEQLRRFVAQHGSVSIQDTQGNTRILPSGDPDIFELVAKADRFLWDGLWRSRAEMEALVAQAERGLKPGCAECERLEKELISARKRDRDEKDLEGKNEMPALRAFQEHRQSHK